MKSKVFFVRVSEAEGIQGIVKKAAALRDESRVLDCISQTDSVAVKIHFGEEGNTGHVKPECARVICDGISAKGAKAFLSDTNTLYRGKRTNSRDHLAIARAHGFTREALGIDIVIPDDSIKENAVDIDVNGRFVKNAKLACIFVEADAIVAINHFKGHLMTGFAGALKNLGMGCATRVGKLEQHSDIAPIVYKQKCTGCGECGKTCPAGAISIINDKAVIEGLKCIGCASCIAACPSVAIDVHWESGSGSMQEKMVEYTKAVMMGKKDKAAFFNFALKITKECDCLAEDDPRVCRDIGIMASNDPVSIDKACYDLVVEASGRDIFQELHLNRDGRRHLEYACKLGLGNLEYELIELGAR